MERYDSITLASCLRGKAHFILENVEDNENLEYEELKSKLELRFREGLSLQNCYSEFTNQKQKFGESFTALGIVLEGLARRAYPECSFAVQDKIACEQFISAINDTFVRRTLQLERITSLKSAVERAKAIKNISSGNYERNSKKNYNYSKDFEKNSKFNNKFYKKRFDGDSQKKKEAVKRGNFQKEKEHDREARKGIECWSCGHYCSECPLGKEN